MLIVDHKIHTHEMVRPIGVMKFCSIVQFLYVKTDQGNKRVISDLGETYGKTEEDAERKMQDKIDAWVKDQTSNNH